MNLCANSKFEYAFENTILTRIGQFYINAARLPLPMFSTVKKESRPTSYSNSNNYRAPLIRSPLARPFSFELNGNNEGMKFEKAAFESDFRSLRYDDPTPQQFFNNQKDFKPIKLHYISPYLNPVRVVDIPNIPKPGEPIPQSHSILNNPFLHSNNKFAATQQITQTTEIIPTIKATTYKGGYKNVFIHPSTDSSVNEVPFRGQQIVRFDTTITPSLSIILKPKDLGWHKFDLKDNQKNNEQNTKSAELVLSYRVTPETEPPDYYEFENGEVKNEAVAYDNTKYNSVQTNTVKDDIIGTTKFEINPSTNEPVRYGKSYLDLPYQKETSSKKNSKSPTLETTTNEVKINFKPSKPLNWNILTTPIRVGGISLNRKNNNVEKSNQENKQDLTFPTPQTQYLTRQLNDDEPDTRQPLVTPHNSVEKNAG